MSTPLQVGASDDFCCRALSDQCAIENHSLTRGTPRQPNRCDYSKMPMKRFPGRFASRYRHGIVLSGPKLEGRRVGLIKRMDTAQLAENCKREGLDHQPCFCILV